MRTLLKYWLPVFLWMGFIFWLSTDSFSSENTSSVIRTIIQFLLPGIAPATMDVLHAGIRKCAHITEYFILSLLLFRAFQRCSMELKVWQWAGLALIATILYAAGDEFHQSFTNSRTASVVDVVIDAFGGMLAQAVIVAWSYFKQRDIS